MPTTKELISNILELEEDKEFSEFPEEEGEIDGKLVIAKQALTEKVDSLDWFITELDRRIGAIYGEATSLKAEIDRLKRKKNSTMRVKKFVGDELLPMVCKTMGNNGIFETDTARYKLYETYGPVEVNTAICHKDFIKTEILVKPDKVLARKKAIEADKEGIHIDGISIYKVEKVRRT